MEQKHTSLNLDTTSFVLINERGRSLHNLEALSHSQLKDEKLVSEIHRSVPETFARKFEEVKEVIGWWRKKRKKRRGKEYLSLKH